MRYLLIPLLLCGCLSDAKRVDAKREKSAKSIPEITELMEGHENAMSFYWIYRTQSENLRQGAFSPNQAQAIGRTMASYMQNEKGEPIKGTVDGLEPAVKEALSPWSEKNMKGNQWSESSLNGYCDKLMEIAESCRRAAK